LRGTSVAQPVRALAGFQRVALAAGETKRVSFDLGPEVFALWDAQQHFAVEPETADIWISADAAHGTPARLSVSR
jgi:beta-glucosidase